MCATSRKRIVVLALSGADCVTRLARQHGTSRKFLRTQRKRARLAVDEAFAEPVSAPLAEPFSRVNEAWVRRHSGCARPHVHAASRGLATSRCEPETAIAPSWRSVGSIKL